MSEYRKFEVRIYADTLRELLTQDSSPVAGQSQVMYDADRFRIEPLMGGSQRDPELLGIKAVWWDLPGSREVGERDT